MLDHGAFQGWNAPYGAKRITYEASDASAYGAVRQDHIKAFQMEKTSNNVIPDGVSRVPDLVPQCPLRSPLFADALAGMTWWVNSPLPVGEGSGVRAYVHKPKKWWIILSL